MSPLLSLSLSESARDWSRLPRPNAGRKKEKKTRKSYFVKNLMQEAVLECRLPKSGTRKETKKLTNKVTYGGVLAHCLKINIVFLFLVPGTFGL